PHTRCEPDPNHVLSPSLLILSCNSIPESSRCLHLAPQSSLLKKSRALNFNPLRELYNFVQKSNGSFYQSFGNFSVPVHWNQFKGGGGNQSKLRLSRNAAPKK
ncbi:hypothetical protein MTR67_046452, partial [Solanum verrucosum]